MTPILEVSGLIAGYEPDLPILNAAHLHVSAGEIVAVLGPNGAGKSTLIKAIAGLVPIWAGTVRFDGADITGAPAHHLIGAGLAFVPQNENVFGGMTVADNLRLALDIVPQRDRKRRLATIEVTFPDLMDLSSRSAGRLSGGQRQMVAIARALVVSPRLIMLDEPSAGLSPLMVARVFERLEAIRRSGVTVVLVEQNVRAALELADRAVILVQGEVRHEGPSRALVADVSVAEMYLGGLAISVAAPATV